MGEYCQKSNLDVPDTFNNCGTQITKRDVEVRKNQKHMTMTEIEEMVWKRKSARKKFFDAVKSCTIVLKSQPSVPGNSSRPGDKFPRNFALLFSRKI